jgi:hypothetical protein
MAPSRLPRVRAAFFSASVTSSVRMWSAIDHPTTRREKQYAPANAGDLSRFRR